MHAPIKLPQLGLAAIGFLGCLFYSTISASEAQRSRYSCSVQRQRKILAPVRAADELKIIRFPTSTHQVGECCISLRIRDVSARPDLDKHVSLDILWGSS